MNSDDDDDDALVVLLHKNKILYLECENSKRGKDN